MSCYANHSLCLSFTHSLQKLTSEFMFSQTTRSLLSIVKFLSTFTLLYVKFSTKCSPLPVFTVPLCWEQTVLALIKCLVPFISDKTLIRTQKLPLSSVSHSVLPSLSVLFVYLGILPGISPLSLHAPTILPPLKERPTSLILTPSHPHPTLPWMLLSNHPPWELGHFPANQITEHNFEW